MTTTKTHLAALRAFWADNRAVFASNPRLSHAESDPLHKARGVRMFEWAQTVDIEAVPLCLEEAVVIAYAQVVLACEARDGINAVGWETFCQPPEASHFGVEGEWRVSWESGPDGWGVYGGVVPDTIREGDTWHTEPYNRFDICFMADSDDA